jgi:hypothetical protein
MLSNEPTIRLMHVPVSSLAEMPGTLGAATHISLTGITVPTPTAIMHVAKTVGVVRTITAFD